MPSLSHIHFPSRSFQWLSSSSEVTKLDLRSVYNLVRIKEGDEWKTALLTTRGHYEYTVMPYGLRNAPSVFQAFINDVLRDMIGHFVIAYIDDILVYSPDLPTHVRHVREVLARLLEHQLYVKGEKCEFHQGSVSFLGYVISLAGVIMDDHKLSPAERNYSIEDKELLAVKLAFEEWRHWLEGAQHPFLVLMDHKNLEYLRSAKRLNSRQARCALFFTHFNFPLTYRPGTRNTKADALSYIYEPEASEEPNPKTILEPTVFLAPCSGIRRLQLCEQISKFVLTAKFRMCCLPSGLSVLHGPVFSVSAQTSSSLGAPPLLFVIRAWDGSPFILVDMWISLGLDEVVVLKQDWNSRQCQGMVEDVCKVEGPLAGTTFQYPLWDYHLGPRLPG
ncbi:hypothetical protein NFI96_004803 [Prochilodus magdalenae]|nr:hypothetical protein NFI96_004803 [Prochilodus magdalenae]